MTFSGHFMDQFADHLSCKVGHTLYVISGTSELNKGFGAHVFCKMYFALLPIIDNQKFTYSYYALSNNCEDVWENMTACYYSIHTSIFLMSKTLCLCCSSAMWDGFVMHLRLVAEVLLLQCLVGSTSPQHVEVKRSALNTI